MNHAEYLILKAFLEYFSDAYLCLPDLPAESRPIAMLNKTEQQSLASARQGLAMAINDCLAATDSWKAEKVFELDSVLRDKGIISLSQLRLEYSRKVKKILERGSLKSRTEYYLVKNIVAGASQDVQSSDIEMLSSMLEAYELS